MNHFDIAQALHADPTLLLPPSMGEIGETVEAIRELLYPHHQRYPIEAERMIGRIEHQLRRLVAIAFESAHKTTPAKADAITNAFLETLPMLRQQGRQDIRAAILGDPAVESEEEVIAYYPGFRALFLHRIAHTLHGLGVPMLPRGIAEYAHTQTGIDIHPSATIGEGLFIDHGTGVVVGETANIGDNVKIYQGVTLGALSFRHDEDGQVIREEKRHPTIEDNVTIYANATVLGGKTIIGHDSVIGGGIWLTRSVEPYSKVLMESPRIVHEQCKRM